MVSQNYFRLCSVTATFLQNLLCQDKRHCILSLMGLELSLGRDCIIYCIIWVDIHGYVKWNNSTKQKTNGYVDLLLKRKWRLNCYTVLNVFLFWACNWGLYSGPISAVTRGWEQTKVSISLGHSTLLVIWWPWY